MPLQGLNDATPNSFRETERLIRPYIRRTPIVEVDGADFGLPCRLVFKLEFMQRGGSFKARGAFANLLLSDIPKAGVVAASGGNHGAAVAYAARALGAPAKIFVPEISSPAKIARIRSYGADLVVGGKLYSDAVEAADAFAAKTGARSVHAYDSWETINGAGSLGLEFAEQAGDLDAVLIAVGGGGLIAGAAAALSERTRVIGVEPDQAPTLFRALAAGEPVDAPAGGVAADSLAPKRIGARPFAVARDRVEKVVLVADDDIVKAQKALWEGLRIVAEPGAATPFAALLSGAFAPQPDARIGVILSGANTTAVNFDA